MVVLCTFWILIVAYSLKARTVESQQLAVTRQRPINNNRGMAFSAQSVACNSGIHHAIAKQQLHCNRRMVFSTWSVPRCYKQDHLDVAVPHVEAGLNTSTIAL
jgi:hypothetical protein